MKKKILILGSGYIGTKLAAKLNLDCYITSKRINNYYDAEKIFEEVKPDIVINAIGVTGDPNVDALEEIKDKTLFSNTYIPILLAELCFRTNTKLIHISSGCIFHTKSMPIDERRAPDFLDLFYSRTKIYSESALSVLINLKRNILVTRIRIPLDDTPHPKNILTKLIKYKKVIAVANSVTYIPDFIEGLRVLIIKDARGICNLVNEGACLYPELLDVYKKHVPDFKYEIMPCNELKLTRTNVLLSTKNIASVEHKMRNIKDVYDECVKQYVFKNVKYKKEQK